LRASLSSDGARAVRPKLATRSRLGSRHLLVLLDPDLGTGLGTWDLVLRKLAHTAEYAILGALLVRATGRAGLALAIGTLYAVSDEVHQVFVAGRHGSPIDVAIDAVGIAVGIALWQTVRTRRLA